MQISRCITTEPVLYTYRTLFTPKEGGAGKRKYPKLEGILAESTRQYLLRPRLSERPGHYPSRPDLTSCRSNMVSTPGT